MIGARFALGSNQHDQCSDLAKPDRVIVMLTHGQNQSQGQNVIRYEIRNVLEPSPV